MTNSYAIDTNILIYIYDLVNEHKKIIAAEIIAEKPFIATQVISEYINVSKRLLNLPKKELIHKCGLLIGKCIIIPITHATLMSSEALIEKYDFQLFDSIIVASDLEAGCSTLYSEDMQHNQFIENQLKIVNPFL